MAGEARVDLRLGVAVLTVPRCGCLRQGSRCVEFHIMFPATQISPKCLDHLSPTANTAHQSFSKVADVLRKKKSRLR